MYSSSSFPFTAATLIMVSLFSSISPLLAKSSNKNLLISTPTIAAAPAVLPESPLASPPSSYQELSPDITPLLPSPSGGLIQPTIPSSPSPPNPDDALIGPDSAYAPDGSLQDSSASRCFISVYKLSMVFGVLCFLLFQALSC